MIWRHATRRLIRLIRYTAYFVGGSIGLNRWLELLIELVKLVKLGGLWIYFIIKFIIRYL
jgi:hypothetical protein